MEEAANKLADEQRVKRNREDRLMSFQTERETTKKHMYDIHQAMEKIDRQIVELNKQKAFLSRSFWFAAVYKDKCEEEIDTLSALLSRAK